MAIILEVISTVDNDIFDRIFDSSFPHMENGTIDWELYKEKGLTVNTAEQKKEAIKIVLNSTFNRDNMETCLISKDGYAVVYLAAEIYPSGEYGLPIFLAGPDSNGSKSYLYDPDFREQIRAHALQFNNNNTAMRILYNNKSETNTIRNYMNNMGLRKNATREDLEVDPDPNFSDEGAIKMNISLTD